MQNIIIGLILLVSAGTVVVIISPWEDPQPSQEDIANESDPLTSLQSTIASSRWGQTYWAKQAQAQTPLWTDAKTWCLEPDHKDLPNCGHVHLAAFISQPRPAVPEYGSQGGFGKMPTIGVNKGDKP